MVHETRDPLVSFVDEFVGSFEAWDILAYLAAHPDANLSLDDMAVSLGRSPGDLASAAATLEAKHILLPGSGGGWTLSGDPELRRALASFSEAIADHKRRLFILTRLLENLSR